MGLGGFAARHTPYACVGTGAIIWIVRGALQQSSMGRVVSARKAHTSQGVSAIEILTTDLGLLYLAIK
ncbi:hypothetical protein PROH_00510 [Prochlorothrix hollandica PCC 9006 = CALU 1027]|uniref:Uncharacterized protein n=1 Tax=Prochlorothrix hollandica PCC 9006 = CALU 1027 TaxID=317619 RepID=A0A0M2PXR4_PROHO|nr:hypothetical protein PROH_00510 [Prochlorothrix hollandica PCC 9006 = CALU 1027]